MIHTTFLPSRFILVDIGDAGRHSDGGILSNSPFGQALETGALSIPDPSPLPGILCTQTIVQSHFLNVEQVLQHHPSLMYLWEMRPSLFAPICYGLILVETYQVVYTIYIQPQFTFLNKHRGSCNFQLPP